MRAVLLCLLVACGSRHEGDIALRVTNPPTCPAGKTPAAQVVMRLENGSDFIQQAMSDHMIAANTWAGRTGTLKLALCPLNDSCPQPVWIRTRDVVVRGDDHGLELTLPELNFEMPCNDVGAR